MKGLTHLTGAAAASIALATAAKLTVPDTVLAVSCSMVASLIPDIDICTSKAGRLFKPASLIIQLFIGHRTMFHAPFLYLVLLGALSYIYPAQQLLLVAGAVGIGSHLLLDMLNPAGIPLLWPLPNRIRIGAIRSGGILDWLLGVVLSIFAIIAAAAYIRSL